MPKINSIEDIKRYYPDLWEEFVEEVRAEVERECGFNLTEAYQRWAEKMAREREERLSEEEQRHLMEALHRLLVEDNLTPPEREEDPTMATLRRLLVEEA